MPDHRCRLCTANDPAGPIDYLAEQLWESRRDLAMQDPAWEDAGVFWQTRFRELAITAIHSLRAA